MAARRFDPPPHVFATMVGVIEREYNPYLQALPGIARPDVAAGPIASAGRARGAYARGGEALAQFKFDAAPSVGRLAAGHVALDGDGLGRAAADHR